LPGLLLLSGLIGCAGPASVPLAYEPTGAAPVALSRPVVAVGGVVDARGEPAEWLGVATGDPGFPERSLEAEPAAARAVRDAFTSALMARGLLAPPGRQSFDLAVRVVRLHAGEGLERRAEADFIVTLTRHRGGGGVYTDEVRTSGVGSGPFSLDTAAYVPVSDVADLAQRTMNKAIETELDSRGFQAAVHRIRVTPAKAGVQAGPRMYGIHGFPLSRE